MSYSYLLEANVLTPVKELDEELSLEANAKYKLHEEQRQNQTGQDLKNSSDMSTNPNRNVSNIIKYGKCSDPNCKTCSNSADTVLSDEANSGSSSRADTKDSVAESQAREKGDSKFTSSSKSTSKDLSHQKKKLKVTSKTATGSPSSVLKGKKPNKSRKMPGPPTSSQNRAESRLQKGKEYEAKTTKTLKRMDEKYKSLGSPNVSPLHSKITPVIEDVYPAREDNSDQLLKKVKVTTTNVPYYIRSRSAPARKRTQAKQPDTPKSSRTKKSTNLKELVNSESALQMAKTKTEEQKNGEQNEENINQEDNLHSEENIPNTNIEPTDDVIKPDFDEDFDNRRHALHKIKSSPSRLCAYLEQAAINEGVEEIVLVDFLSNTNLPDIHRTSGGHGLNPMTEQSDDELSTGGRWQEDSEVLVQNHHGDKTDMLHLNGNLEKDESLPEFQLKIDIPTTSDSSVDRSSSSTSEKIDFALPFLSHRSQNQNEASLTFGSSIGISFRDMFVEDLDRRQSIEAEENQSDFSDLDNGKLLLSQDENSLSEDDDSIEIISPYVIIPNDNDLENIVQDKITVDCTSENKYQFDKTLRILTDSLSTKNSSSSTTSTSSFVKLPPIQNLQSITRPKSSRAWDTRVEIEKDIKDVQDSLDADEHRSIPFERYQSEMNGNGDTNSEEVAISNINGKDDQLPLEDSLSSARTVLTEQALKEHDLFHNKHLDAARDSEPHYTDEDRANMQSRLSSATATTDFSIVTDSTITGDNTDTAEFNGLKKGKELGHGAYGTVFEGLTANGKLIAVKQVELTIANRDIATKEFKRVRCEVDLLRTLQHKNIVRLLGTSFDGACVQIFMEHVPGGSIKSILMQYGALHERIFRKYTKQILEGLSYLHTLGVVHRDIKGSNIMLMTNGVIKLIDFGCAKRLRESALLRESTGSRDAKLLKTMLGTPYWMAPEVITSQGHGPKSDIWSVGATVYEMATTQPPLKNLEATAAMFYIGSGNEMPDLPKGQFSRSVINFVKKCFTRDQYQRPRASELLNHRFITRQKITKVTSN